MVNTIAFQMKIGIFECCFSYEDYYLYLLLSMMKMSIYKYCCCFLKMAWPFGKMSLLY